MSDQPIGCGFERMAVLLELAANIFYARVLTGEQRDDRHFEALPSRIRHAYLELALSVVNSPAAVTRQGSPAVPPPSAGTDGVTQPVDPLFDQIVAVARCEAARVLAFRGQDTSNGRE